MPTLSGFACGFAPAQRPLLPVLCLCHACAGLRVHTAERTRNGLARGFFQMEIGCEICHSVTAANVSHLDKKESTSLHLLAVLVQEEPNFRIHCHSSLLFPCYPLTLPPHTRECPEALVSSLSEVAPRRFRL